jgi:hypothetical protein
VDGYLAWIESDIAIDMNEDLRINREDYALWVEYLVWRDSDSAEDFTGDRRINTEDYMLWVNFNAWRLGNDALDFNDDSRIDILDYRIFGDYTLWLEGDDALDFNDDDLVDELDYILFLEGNEFAGEYYITDYNYSGPEVYLIDSGIFFSDLGYVIDEFILMVDLTGAITIDIPNYLKTLLGSDLLIIETTFNNMTIERISPFIVVIDTTILLAGTTINLTFNMTEIEGGFFTSTSFAFQTQTVVIFFDIIRVDA